MSLESQVKEPELIKAKRREGAGAGGLIGTLHWDTFWNLTQRCSASTQADAQATMHTFRLKCAF